MLKSALALLLFSAMLQAAAGSPVPGVLNSFTGQVWINSAAAAATSAGPTILEPGRSIRTGEGMAELLLSPGSFVRLGGHSELTLQVTGTSDIGLRLDRGEALIEVLVSQPTPVILKQNAKIYRP